MKTEDINRLGNNEILRQAAIVCNEIAASHAPILYAERSEPQDPADSGWQFLCGASEENMESAKVWAVHEVLDFDPSLLPYIELPIGTVLSRASANGVWQAGSETR